MSKDTTDTNQASELYELCKEVYELTNWRLPISERPVEYWVQHDDEWDLEYGVAGMPVDGGIVPRYTSDYLLEKLPYIAKDQWKFNHYGPNIEKSSKAWTAFYGDLGTEPFIGTSDTPLKALLKLTIALSR